MDYYEEFGISRTASAGEIRQAHKKLARLFHPDRIQDEELRDLAESQMKRLNAIHQVLGDPEARRQYDASLGMPPAPATGQTWQAAGRPWLDLARIPEPARGALQWGLALVVFLIAVSLVVPGRRMTAPQMEAAADAIPIQLPAPEPDPPTQAAPKAQTSSLVLRQQSRRIASLEAANRQLRQALDAASDRNRESADQIHRLEDQLAQTSKSVPPPATPPVPPKLANPRIPTPAADPASSDLNGTWFYVRQDTGGPSEHPYPPEYIEAVIVDDGSHVRGRYRGRYTVGDLAISPEVSFTFNGEANQEGRFHWVGNGGSRGEVQVELVSANSLRIEWYASELGEYAGLASGSAVLIRRQ